jgi:internalin A
VRNRIVSISLAVALALSIGLMSCGSEEVPEITEYNLTISSTEGGSVISPGQPGPYTYDEGEVVNLVAIPDEGYQFVSWIGDVDTIANTEDASTTIVVNGDYSIRAVFEQEEVVTFVDPNLEAAVRQAIAKPEGPIYARDMERLVSLHGEEMGISDLGGLEYATSLTWLGLWSNQLSDISPLANLTRLAGLGLGNNRIDDVASLANLTKLERLGLGSNQIDDISPLANLTKLVWLNLENNRISDISPLAGLTSLVHLDLDTNQLTDISFLANLTDLAELEMRSNQISDLSPLEDLTNMTQLDLDDNWVSDISPLANLSNLTRLSFSGGSNQISNISPLTNLTNLTWLNLGENLVTDFSPLASLINLTGLALGYSRISDLSCLAGLAGLTQLWLDHNQISDISPLANLTGLTSLSLWGNQIDSLLAVANLADLTELNLGCNRISDISPLVNLTDLIHLYLHDNRISDVSPLANHTSLIWLSLWGNEIGDLAPLANLINLAGLELGGNRISDITALVENEGLSEGDYVDLRWNVLTSDSISVLIPQLEARGVKFNPEFPLDDAYPCLLDTEWIKNPATGNYYALTSPMSWMAAEACAQGCGAHLVTLNSWEEELWIKDVFGRDESFWIGFNVIGREHRASNFAWSSGEPVTYTNWGPSEPNNCRGEDVAHINPGDYWNDLSRYRCLRGVVETSEEPG